MKEELNIKFAQQAAEENDLVYAPDDIALAWMGRFSELIRLGERDKCAQVCEQAGLLEAAKLLREIT